MGWREGDSVDLGLDGDSLGLLEGRLEGCWLGPFVGIFVCGAAVVLAARKPEITSSHSLEIVVATLCLQLDGGWREVLHTVSSIHLR